MIVSAILFMLAAACWARISFFMFHETGARPRNTDKKPFSFWGSQSWNRKYKRYKGEVGFKDTPRYNYIKIEPPKNWYYKLFALKYKEKFPLSATVLVFTTDGYHFFQWIMIKLLVAAITLNLFWYGIIWAAWLVGFNLTYIYLKKRKLKG